VKSTLERHEILRPKTTQYLNLLGLSRAARFPFHSERFVFNVIHPRPMPSLRRPPLKTSTSGACLAIRPVCSCGAIRTPVGEPNGLGDRGQKAKRDKGLVERILLIVKRHPAIPALCAEDVIWDFDICVPDVFRRLRPIADLRGVCSNISRERRRWVA
jgi:hypothetical protein